MPTTLWLYITVLLYFPKMTSCKAMAEALGNIAHDCLTRMLKGSWSGQELFDYSLRFLFTPLAGGWLCLDDTILEKPHSTWLSEACWHYSHTKKKPVFGVPIVLLVWSDGKVRIPIGYRIWKPGGSSKIDLALELLSHARNRLGIKPRVVLFDSWYPSKRLLKRIKDYGWKFVCQLKKNRGFNGVQLKHYRSHPYWNAVGNLAGGLRVFVVRHRKKYFATNWLSLSAKEVRKWYKCRQDVEEVFKVLKSELGLEGCQSGYSRGLSRFEAQPQEQTQGHHISLCLVAYLILEKECFQKGVTLRKLRRDLILKRFEIPLPALCELRDSA